LSYFFVDIAGEKVNQNAKNDLGNAHNLKIMINQKQIRFLLKKTENKFISKTTLSRILKVDSKKALELLTYLGAQGFIEEAEIDGYWQQSLRGKLLRNQRFNKDYKVETLKKHLRDLIQRAETINASTEFPDRVACIKITSEYPIEHRSGGIHLAYSLRQKEITDEEYESAADKLREQYSRGFGNMVEDLFYPYEAIRTFLKSRSHVLKLTKYEKDEIKQIVGYRLFGED
jgi:hypothetical protein